MFSPATSNMLLLHGQSRVKRGYGPSGMGEASFPYARMQLLRKRLVSHGNFLSAAQGNVWASVIIYG